MHIFIEEALLGGLIIKAKKNGRRVITPLPFQFFLKTYFSITIFLTLKVLLF